MRQLQDHYAQASNAARHALIKIDKVGYGSEKLMTIIKLVGNDPGMDKAFNKRMPLSGPKPLLSY